MSLLPPHHHSRLVLAGEHCIGQRSNSAEYKRAQHELDLLLFELRAIGLLKLDREADQRMQRPVTVAQQKEE